MINLKPYYSCAELAAMQLPGMPTNKRNIREKVMREGWPGKKRAFRGGGYEYQPPAPVMSLIKEKLLVQMINRPRESAPEESTSVATQHTAMDVASTKTPVSQKIIVPPAQLKNWQKNVAQARLAICQEVDYLADQFGTDKAVRMVVDMANKHELPPNVQKQVSIANARSGISRKLSRSTIYRWMQDLKTHRDNASNISILAPKQRDYEQLPAWAPKFLELYGQPQKPSARFCVERLAQLLPPEIQPPSYTTAYRFIKKMSSIDRNVGRMGSREIKTIMPFVRRDTTDLLPAEIYTADGHTFDAEVAHRMTGKPCRPEITTVIDVLTRRAVGWSAGLVESTWAVLDALRNACENGGIPSIFYVDNGSGYKNATMSDTSNGFMKRLGIQLAHSLPYNSQARGIIERAHKSIWVRGAQMMPTYMGAQMDAQAKQKVFKITRKQIKEFGKSRLLMEWSDFLLWAQQQVDDYNNRQHSGLPKIRDENGVKRHMTPNEMWQKYESEGWEKVSINKDDADDLFRPVKICKVIRGEVRLFNNLYFSNSLEHYHGETADVCYDIHDASRVWVKERHTGRLICIAHFAENRRSYMPQSQTEQAAYNRAKARLKRVDIKRDDILDELEGTRLIEHQEAMQLPSMAIEPAKVQPDPIEQQQEIVDETVKPLVERPKFATEIDRYRWLMNNKHWWTVKDAKFLMRYTILNTYFDMREIYTYEGIGWTKADQEKAETIKKNEDSAEQ